MIGALNTVASLGRFKWSKALASAALALAFVILAIRLGTPSVLDGVSFSRQVRDRNGILLRMTLSGDEKFRAFTPLSEVSPTFIEALLLLEDRHFYLHPGVNPVSILRAAASLATGSDQGGGSTLTMQLARVRYGMRTRTIGGKLRQIARAFGLELRHSKNELLEAYLNVAPFGANIEGIGAASLIYFSKRPSELTLSESLLLAIIPQNPTQRSLAAGGEARADDTLKARKRLLGQWLARYPSSRDQLADLNLPLSSQRLKSMPFLAPHFTEMVLKESTGQASIRTSLDTGIQAKVEARIESYLKAHEVLGVRNAAALLVDYRRGEVVSLVGSRDFGNDKIQGQVNGVLARRSPGSTLKPLVYGLAVMQGLIHPRTLLKDTPRSYGGFDPENFDHRYAGPIPAEQALIESRNVPAVELTQNLKSPSLYQFLTHAGIRFPREERHYGLSLALGGAEISMWELASLYTMLARLGTAIPLQLLPRTDPLHPDRQERRLLSPESAFVTLEMLARNPRPDRPFARSMIRTSYPAAWKTGTSYAFRDAWTAGVVGPYVLIVWLGNFDNQSNPAFLGRELAAPLFFDIADAIANEDFSLPRWQMSSSGLALRKVEVCALSGHLPNGSCPHRIETSFIPGTSPITTCSIHRSILVDSVTGKRLCGVRSGQSRMKTFEFWPSDLLEHFAAAGIARRPPPPFADLCPWAERDLGGNEPEIFSPREGVVYLRSVNGAAGREQIPLRAITDADTKSVFWFANQRFIGKASANQPFMFSGSVGNYTISAVDDLGRSDSRSLQIRAVQ